MMMLLRGGAGEEEEEEEEEEREEEMEALDKMGTTLDLPMDNKEDEEEPSAKPDFLLEKSKITI